jgi:hypothetical protein
MYHNKQKKTRNQVPCDDLHNPSLDHIITSSQPSTELYTSRLMLFTGLWTIR